MLSEDWSLAAEAIVNHLVEVRRGGGRKAAVDPKEAGAVPGCLGSSALFLSASRDPTCAELRRLWRTFSASLRSDVSGVPGSVCADASAGVSHWYWR